MFRFIAVFICYSFALLASDPTSLIKEAKLLLEDDFNRSETDDNKEELGKEWVTNSAKRAKGVKQADLKDNTLHITMAKVADHAISVRHDAPFDDGIVQARFKMHDAKGMKFNFNDPKARKVCWAGHISGIVVKPKSITIQDHKTGIFDLKLREIKKDPNATKEAKKKANQIIKSKEATFKVSLKQGQWYQITIINQGPKLTVYIDDKKIGSFSSEGNDHKVKQNLAFSVPGKVSIDDLKIWSLDK